MAKDDLIRGLLDIGGDTFRRLQGAYDARAQQMTLPSKKRVQPRTGRDPYIDTDFQTPAPSEGRDDLSLKYPRNPDPSAPLPLGDRARTLVEGRSEIASALARRIEESGQMDANTRYFYHSDGPLYRAALRAGLTPEEASSWLNDFGNVFAATSPRTEVEFNLRNATSALAKEAAGIPHRTIVGPGSGGISEAGYPMMTGPGGIHGKLLDEVFSGRGIDTSTNTKPYFFGNNMVGNRSGVTVDTHAIRGTLQTLNQIEPGAVPEGYILPEFRDAYRADPTTLTPNMISDTIGTQKIGPKGARIDAQTEYPVFADIFHDAGGLLGVSPAETQSMAWFGFGDETNLASAPKTVSEVFDDRLDVTAQLLNLPVDEAASRVFRRQIPLLGAGGAAALAAMPGEADAQTPAAAAEAPFAPRSVEALRQQEGTLEPRTPTAQEDFTYWLADKVMRVGNDFGGEMDFNDAYRRVEPLGDLLSFLPGPGTAMATVDGKRALDDGRYVDAALGLGSGLLDVATVGLGGRAVGAADNVVRNGLIDVPQTPQGREYFSRMLGEARDSQGALGRSVDVYSPDDYAGMTMRMTPDGSAGYVVKPDGELASLVKHKDSPARGFSATALRDGETEGATWLNAFDTALTGLYGSNGYRPVSRLPFSEDFARSDWGDEAVDAFMRANRSYNGGRPDLVFMARDPARQSAAGGLLFDDWDAAVGALEAEMRQLGYR